MKQCIEIHVSNFMSEDIKTWKIGDVWETLNYYNDFFVHMLANRLNVQITLKHFLNLKTEVIFLGKCSCETGPKTIITTI